MNCTPDYALNEISWQNLLLYVSALPSYDDEDVDDGVKDIDWDRFDALNDNNINKELPEYVR